MLSHNHYSPLEWNYLVQDSLPHEYQAPGEEK